MNKLILSLAVVGLLFSCNTESKKTEEVKSITLEELATSAENLKDKIISLEGMVTHVCQHGGQKMFLTDTSQEINLLVRVGKSIPEFDVALQGSTVEVTGKLIVTIAELEGDGATHDGSGNGQGDVKESNTPKADCATEEALKEKGEGDACTTNITYHIEATSYKEITKQ